MRNKKANVPITILIVATIAVCIIALVAFYYYREGVKEKINVFKYLRVMYNIKEGITYSGAGIDYIKGLYNKQSWFGKKLVGYRNYYPVVEQMKEENGFLVYKQVKIDRKARLGIPPWEKIETILFELKVPFK